MSILIENVSKQFNNKIVLDSINLEIKTGSLVALLGGSGSGKSTLLRVVAGFEKPDNGRVWLHGKNSHNLSVQEKEIGFVFQTYALFQHLTVYENIAFGLSVIKKKTLANSNDFVRRLLPKIPIDRLQENNASLTTRDKQIPTFITDKTNPLTMQTLLDPFLNFNSDGYKGRYKNVVNTIQELKGDGYKRKYKGIQNNITNKNVEDAHYLQSIALRNIKRSTSVHRQVAEISTTNSIPSPLRNNTVLYQATGIDRLQSNQSVKKLLKLVELEEFATRYPSQLSGGQCQRVALARALAVEPKVLLLDEPFGALDQKVRKQLRRWLRQLHEKVGVTTIFVTHDYQEAMEVANEIVVLEQGRVKHSLQQPKNFYYKITQSSN